ncbi:XRE family transcriptional regulator [Sulfobacillus thermosulfidooxidans]|uniref:XRE family transcriptional regulator n=1 Tax=Sulfobacillus thermosulfidooxidans TaxID=28034 RepID=UPI0006B5ABA1|nr:XRE family transcriptional regulator [Sulfobacillus thermosulfidooxidans]
MGTTAAVNPAALRWAREQSGNISVDDVARKLRVPVARVADWEKGVSFPSWSQLSSLAKWYRLPTVYFYMDSPPSDSHSPPDFRSSSGAGQDRRPWLAAELRRLHNVRNVAIELRESLGRNPCAFGARISLQMDVEKAATLIVDALKRRTTVPEPGRERAKPDLWYARWRRALEDTDIIVMQMRERVAVSEFRGLSVSYSVAPAILVNQRDAISGRLFTMLHEVVHIALNQAGICSPQYDTEESGKDIERFCNRVAAEVLIPRSVFSAAVVRNLDADPLAASATISALTGASRESALVRAVELGLLNRQKYYKAVEEVRGTYTENVRRTTGGPPRDRLAMSRVGYAFGELVFEALAAKKITAIEASRYLDNLPVRYLPDAEMIVRQHFEGSHE